MCNNERWVVVGGHFQTRRFTNYEKCECNVIRLIRFFRYPGSKRKGGGGGGGGGTNGAVAAFDQYL